MSIAVVHNKKRPLTHVGQVSKIADELKSYMKSLKGSHFIMDRRTNSEDAMHKGNKVPKEKALQILQINDVINQDKIRTVFQPVVSIKTREVVGYEALLRGPQGTKIENPEVFFSLAKEADVVRELDLLCVRHALQNIKKLSENQMLFINIKPITLENIKALQLIFELLKLKRAQWKRAIFEIPESGVYSLSQDAMSGLKYLRDLGAKVAIDDAGSGITSLRDILSVKPDVIKIDMSLIRNIHNDKDRQNILESLMRFARCLGAKAVAEGIETKEEYKYLLKQNVLYGQGYFFARPAPSMIRSIPKNKI
jgi:EAL domain-containing protein (putative c-di-GMP-specific phosphodiesterase class I)